MARRKAYISAILFRAVFLIYAAAVAYLCFANFKSLPQVDRRFLGIATDKIVHFCMFFPLPILSEFAFGKRCRSIGACLGSVVNNWAYCCVFAGLTEIVQGSLPYRSQDVNDFAADCIAIAISAIIVFIFKAIHTRK